MVLAQLKEQTQEQHARLEALIPLPDSMRELMDQLQIFFGFIEPWERALEAALPADDVIRQGRRKTPWLEADLDVFGIDAGQRRHLPRTSDLPSLASRLQILGAAYVLEGSTLGGQFISRHIEERLGLREGRGYRYFRSYGTRVGPMWQAFRAELSRASSPVNDAVMVAAARDMFDLLHRWFSSRLAHGSTVSLLTRAT